MVNKIIVCQIGTRHRYLIPQILNKNNMLYRLYTDTTVYSFIGRILKWLSKFSMFSKMNKRIPNLPVDKIYSSDAFMLKQVAYSLSKSHIKKYWYSRYTGIQKACFRWGIGEADCIYSMFVENAGFLLYAKKKGLKIGFDMYEAANTNHYLIQEIENNADYELYNYLIPNYKLSDAVKTELIEPLLAVADFYTVPSLFVAKSMEEYKNFDSSKVRIVPYASSITVDKYDYRPVKHRLIWVGNEPVRKGLLYCAKAATILKKTYADLDFRIIGKVDDKLKKQETFRDLNFMGVLGKDALMEEFKTAEAYAFPTLFEGFAGTVIEAASCGCPIITTECAGTDINAFPAIYIEPKSVEDIVKAVKSIFEDKSLRNDLSLKVYNYAKVLSPQSYEERLINVLSKL